VLPYNLLAKGSAGRNRHKLTQHLTKDKEKITQAVVLKEKFHPNEGREEVGKRRRLETRKAHV